MKLEQVLREIKGVKAKGPGKEADRLPVTPSLLMSIKRAWGKEACTYDQAMLWAAFLLCFFGFLRSGEVCVPSDSEFDEGAHLTFNDIKIINIQNPQALHVRIKASKTDPFRQGVPVCIGWTNKPLCPVAAMLIWCIRVEAKARFSNSRMGDLLPGLDLLLSFAQQ